MINSHLLYRLSYRGTTARMLLIKKEKSTLVGDLYDVRRWGRWAAQAG